MRGGKRVIVELLAPEGFIHNGDQLEMFVPTVLEVPWRGQSPRVLTRAFQKVSLGAHPPGGPIRNL